MDLKPQYKHYLDLLIVRVELWLVACAAIATFACAVAVTINANPIWPRMVDLFSDALKTLLGAIIGSLVVLGERSKTHSG